MVLSHIIAALVDTTRPVIINGEQYEEQFEAVCECFEDEDAEKIAAALNKMGS